MQQPSNLLKIISHLKKNGYVVIETKPHNKRGKTIQGNALMVKPIANRFVSR